MNKVNEVVSLFANFINYMEVSCYESHFTQKHEQARANIVSIYNHVSETPDKPPSLQDCISFYNDVRTLENVIETDDPDYYNYKRLLRRHIAALSISSIPE
jgi:hypothetical protein